MTFFCFHHSLDGAREVNWSIVIYYHVIGHNFIGFLITCQSWSSVNSLKLVYERWVVESGTKTVLSLAVRQIAS